MPVIVTWILVVTLQGQVPVAMGHYPTQESCIAAKGALAGTPMASCEKHLNKIEKRLRQMQGQ